MIVGLTGYANSGKDTFASVLVEKHGFVRLAFADKVRELALEVNPKLRTPYGDEDWDELKKRPEVRELLQDVGLGVRKVIGENVWVDLVMAQIPKDDRRYVITDVRFPNEVEAIKSIGGKVGRIMRPGVSAVNEHISEHALTDVALDFEIQNDGDVNDLHEVVEFALKEWAK